jgi:hypothetical protein
MEIHADEECVRPTKLAAALIATLDVELQLNAIAPRPLDDLVDEAYGLQIAMRKVLSRGRGGRSRQRQTEGDDKQAKHRNLLSEIKFQK